MDELETLQPSYYQVLTLNNFNGKGLKAPVC